ncbi:SufD family Fe-S cluster assembly protein [Companilactobacillus allii]|uniref:Fe-S cluster assembly protein SufD n=1 Tax=Companilactobacillus allii TaxID=1847728 RepID=A0A1P8Q472_9LACO|nr:SufD family Fe-S cluster assembly protein [Companilactobacillus allii]APX72658.1 hypothetical protein BTM29_08885 [Companilactobacillus allii]USQ69762.1 SufD family Fe-S cluster assembly protein [Companilactobacillus allii]
MEFNKEFLEDFELAANDHGEPHWLVDGRVEALNEFNELDYPQSKKINWDLLEINEPKWHKSNRQLIPDCENNGNIQIIQLGQKVIVNNLTDDLEEAGVVITDIFTAFRQHPRLIQKSFMNKVINSDEDKFTAFHAAMLNAGIFVYIPKGIQVDQTIEIHVLKDDTLNLPLITHVLVVAEGDSSVNIVEEITDKGSNKNIFNGFTEVLARMNAKIDFKILNKLSGDGEVFLKDKAYLGKGATVNWEENLLNDSKTYASFENNLFGADSKVKTTLNVKSPNNKEFNINVVKHGNNVSSEFDKNFDA